MPATVDVGTGTTVTFGTSGFNGELLSLGWSGIARESIDTSHMGQSAAPGGTFGNRTFIPGDLSDPGELSLEVHFNPESTQTPLIDDVAETITVTWPLASGDATAATWAASGFVTSFDITDPLDDKMTATITVKLSGNVTQTASTT